MSTLQGFSDYAFIEKPASGWLHKDGDLTDGNAITYTVQVGWVAAPGAGRPVGPVNLVYMFRRLTVCRSCVRTGVDQQLEARNPDRAHSVTSGGGELWGCMSVRVIRDVHVGACTDTNLLRI